MLKLEMKQKATFLSSVNILSFWSASEEKKNVLSKRNKKCECKRKLSFIFFLNHCRRELEAVEREILLRLKEKQ